MNAVSYKAPIWQAITLALLTLALIARWAFASPQPAPVITDDAALECFYYFLIPNIDPFTGEDDADDVAVVQSFLDAHGLKAKSSYLFAKAKAIKEYRAEHQRKYKSRGLGHDPDLHKQAQEARDRRFKAELAELDNDAELKQFILGEFKSHIKP